MNSDEYERYRVEREHLKSLLKKGGPERLVKPIRDRLDEIRTTIKNAHREIHDSPK
jgi:hypothetical protein